MIYMQFICDSIHSQLKLYSYLTIELSNNFEIVLIQHVRKRKGGLSPFHRRADMREGNM